MSIAKVLLLDMRKKENEDKIRSLLVKTKWLAKFEKEELTVEILEKCYRKVTKKYPAYLSYIMSCSEESWSFMLKNSDDHKWIETVYAITLFEGLAKILIVLYGHFVKNMAFKYEE